MTKRGREEIVSRPPSTKEAPNTKSLSESSGKRDTGIILHSQLEPQTVGAKKQLGTHLVTTDMETEAQNN